MFYCCKVEFLIIMSRFNEFVEFCGVVCEVFFFFEVIYSRLKRTDQIVAKSMHVISSS